MSAMCSRGHLLLDDGRCGPCAVRRDGPVIPIEPRKDDFGGRRLVTVDLSRVQREEVTYIWRHRLARGRLNGIVGDPGVGKSWVTGAIMAAESLGAPLLGDVEGRVPGRALLLQCEDGLGDTVRPRLEDMGADLERITAVKSVIDEGEERAPSLDKDIATIEAHLIERSYTLVVIDPLNAYLGGTVDSHRDASLRTVLTPLALLAERRNVAVVFVMHLNKSSRDRAIYRANGGIGYVAAARIVHLVGVNPDNPQDRVLVCIKNNLAPMRPAVAFAVAEGRFIWKGETSLTSAALLAPDETHDEQSARGEAQQLILETLSEGPMPASEVMNAAEAAGIAKATLRRAREAIGVISRPEGTPGKKGRGRWMWELPDEIKASKVLTRRDVDTSTKSVSGESPDAGGVEHLIGHKQGGHLVKATSILGPWIVDKQSNRR